MRRQILSSLLPFLLAAAPAALSAEPKDARHDRKDLICREAQGISFAQPHRDPQVELRTALHWIGPSGEAGLITPCLGGWFAEDAKDLYSAALRSDKRLARHGQVCLEFRVEASGRVQQVRLESSTFGGHDFERSILKWGVPRRFDPMPRPAAFQWCMDLGIWNHLARTAFGGLRPLHDTDVVVQSEPDPLLRHAMAKVVREHFGVLKFRCDQVQRKAPEIAGRMSIELILDGNGLPQAAAWRSFLPDSLGPSALRAELREKLRKDCLRWRFPASSRAGRRVIVNLHLDRKEQS